MSVAPVVGKAVVAVRRLTRWVLLFGVPLLAVVVGLYLYAHGGRYVETENAYVKADIIAVSAEVSGRVVEVAARDNEPVAAGALLFRLDPTPFEIEQARARAQMDVVRTEVQALRAEYRETVLEATERTIFNESVQYSAMSVGHLMTREWVEIREIQTLGDALAGLRARGELPHQMDHVYVVDGRNILRGPSRFQWDFGVFRQFRVTERFSLQFRAEGFNFTNTPQWGNPNGNRDSSSQAAITEAPHATRRGHV